MAFECKVAADSLAPCGSRLTTFIVTYPRAIHSEIMTHRMLTKSSASSRAIPTEKLIQRVLDDPWIPEYIGANQKGMQAGTELPEWKRTAAVGEWLTCRDAAVAQARQLVALGAHKQIVNRILEPWMFITVIISGTEWDNFFGLRTHEAAEPHFQHIARMMRDAREASTPKVLVKGDWHLPLIFDEDYEAAILADPTHPTTVMENLVKISVGRCARVSYLNHEGKRDVQADIDLHDRLMVQRPLHAAPAEHVAQAMDWPGGDSKGFETPQAARSALVAMLRAKEQHRTAYTPALALLCAQMQSGNYMGFTQYRKTLSDENIGGAMP
jgi:thymidylate synthase ThyX